MSSTFIGSKLYPWQKDVAEKICKCPNENRTVVVKSHRQAGKSFLCEQVLLYYAINFPKSKNAMISPVLSQSRKVFKELVNAIYESGVIKRKNETLLEIELINGSTIFFKSAEMRDALRGETVTGVLIWDEAAFLPQEVAEYTLPWLQIHKANLLIVSTPKIRDGLFYNYWVRGLENKGVFPHSKQGKEFVISIDWCEYDTSAVLSEELKMTYAKVLTKNQFRSEIEGQFLDSDGMVFENVRTLSTANPFNASVPYEGFFIGIDYGSGGGNDYTALSVFDEGENLVFVDYFNDLSTFEQVDRIAKDLNLFGKKIKAIYAENNSIGNAFNDLLVKKLLDEKNTYIASKITRWTTTNDNKAKLVAQFQMELEQMNAKLLNDSTLIEQLCAYEATYNAKTQKVSYNGAMGTHDDLVMSTLLAMEAYKKNNNNGSYMIR